jgi:hypothetical protein
MQSVIELHFNGPEGYIKMGKPSHLNREQFLQNAEKIIDYINSLVPDTEEEVEESLSLTDKEVNDKITTEKIEQLSDVPNAQSEIEEEKFTPPF